MHVSLTGHANSPLPSLCLEGPPQTVTLIRRKGMDGPSFNNVIYFQLAALIIKTHEKLK